MRATGLTISEICQCGLAQIRHSTGIVIISARIHGNDITPWHDGVKEDDNGFRFVDKYEK